MRIQLSYLIIAILFFVISACTHQSGKKEKSQLIVKHVFTNGLPDPYDGSRPDARHDYYYAYNYTDTDYDLFEKMLDTLFIDTAYWSHSYYFMKYDDDLPDTMALKMEMAILYDYD